MQDTPEMKSHATRSRLQARAAELRDRVTRVRSDLRREREPLPKDSADAAIAVENDDVLRNIESSALVEIESIDHALQRIDAGLYAVCEDCGERISDERLDAAPFATRCAHCVK